MSILSDICRDNNIKTIAIDDKIAESWGIKPENRIGAGYAFRVDGESKSYILFDPSDSKWTTRYIVAHELAHVLFGHLRANTISREAQELEARSFSAAFIALMLWDEYRDSKD